MSTQSEETGIDYMTDTRPIAAGETAPGCKKRDPIVVAENVTRSFGGVNAVDVEYLEIPRHKITALIGPNGAGKTTLFNLLTGFDTPNREVAVRRPLPGRSGLVQGGPMGMVRTFQLTKVMGKLTVIENMRLGASEQSGERLSKALFKKIWGATRTRSPSKRTICCKFKLDAKRTTTQRRSPAASGNCSKWHGR